ncbi:OLD family protein [Chryseobacterium carnipullorum]|uniref:Predicted ATP-binding protein involved in virulence n=1 Tax=Chryseobacterium carnipullorum TaxID=1124835 RepID=A0A376E1W2_CHRCU|nr:AAA family ATPase [Chryseobacterium carnipullorum]STD00443.1 Predicted ATP-binding protein involved in virulence [Chryseobacterium carnipullorum]
MGPNEAGKTVILKALQQLNKPIDIEGFDIIRDYPRSLYNDITTEKILAKDIEVVFGEFELDDADKESIPTQFHNCTYVRTIHLDNSAYHYLNNAPNKIKLVDIKKDVARLLAHLDKQNEASNDYTEENKPSAQVLKITNLKNEDDLIDDVTSAELIKLLEKFYPLIEEDNTKEEERYDKLLAQLKINQQEDEVLKILEKRVPTFVLFSNFFKVKPSIHLEHLAERVERKLLEDDKYYDYGNLCLLKLLGFDARELSNIGKTQSPDKSDPEALKAYKDKLDSRTYQLNAASIRLTKEIKNIWNPNPNRPEAEKIRISADGQYLKVTVEDELGVEIELDQRSEGFQWMVSFFVVFFAEAQDKHKNAVLLLDEPGTSLHGLKTKRI